MNVAPDKAMGHSASPRLIDKSQIMTNLSMAKIMPVAERAICNFGEQAKKLPFGWKGLDPDPIFDAQFDACGFGVGQYRLQPLADPIVGRNRFALPDGVQLDGNKTPIEVSA
jgi:hypothetical protein